MKKVLLLLSVVFFYFHAVAQDKSIQSLVGIWETITSGAEGGGLEVKDSTELFLVYGSQKKKIMRYKADFSKTPTRFDFTVQDSSQNLSLKSLLQFINNDLIKWQVFEGDVAPSYFASNDGEILYLRRKK
jgi:hypothetical protein